MSEKPTVTAALVIIGNEVLSGRTQDANVRFLAVGLNRVGVRLMEARVIADAENEIVEAINALRAKFDYVFTTGGIGPTHDDITAAAIAAAFGRTLIRNPEAAALLEAAYQRSGLELNEALVHEIKAQIRAGATPRHVPQVVLAVADIPRTRSGKITELAVRDIIHGREVKNVEALANPEALDCFRDLDALGCGPRRTLS